MNESRMTYEEAIKLMQEEADKLCEDGVDYEATILCNQMAWTIAQIYGKSFEEVEAWF